MHKHLQIAHVQRLCNIYATTVQQLCNIYAIFMQQQCNNCAAFMQQLCNICATSVQQLCNIWATFMQQLCILTFTNCTYIYKLGLKTSQKLNRYWNENKNKKCRFQNTWNLFKINTTKNYINSTSICLGTPWGYEGIYECYNSLNVYFMSWWHF